LAGDVPFYLKFAPKAHFKKRPLQPISVYNNSTVSASENSSFIQIGSRPGAFQRITDTSKSPKLGSKNEFVVVFKKDQFLSNELCYKVSLC